MSQGNTEVTVQVSDGELLEPVCEDEAARDACTVLEALSRVSGKWSVGVLLVTTQRAARFTELEREIKGISRRMLTLTLRNLERDGLVSRTVYPTVPPRVEYSATEMARELYETLTGLTSWADRHRGEIDEARTAYDALRADEAAMKEMDRAPAGSR